MARAKDPVDTTTKNIDLEVYAGNYDDYTRGGEDLVLPWKGKLAIFEAPADNPVKAIELFKYAGKDIFRRMRKDDEDPGEELRFERDAKGKLSECCIIIILKPHKIAISVHG